MFKKKLDVYCDGGARGNPGPAAAAFVVEEEGKIIYKGMKYLGKATNNIAEYKGVILALSWLTLNQDYLNYDVNIILDSELVARQLSGFYKIKNKNLKELYKDVTTLSSMIKGVIFFSSVPRSKNKIADFLVNRVLNENS